MKLVVSSLWSNLLLTLLEPSLIISSTEIVASFSLLLVHVQSSIVDNFFDFIKVYIGEIDFEAVFEEKAFDGEINLLSFLLTNGELVRLVWAAAS